jgi:hypothetical protein
MRTDELRRELRELADEVEPFESDLPGLQRSERRRAVLLRAGAGLVVLLAVVGAVAFWDRGARHARVEVPTKETPVESVHRVELVVVPANERVQRVLEASPLVSRYTPLTRLPRMSEIVSGSNLIDALPEPKEVHDARCALQEAPGFGVQSSTPDVNTARELAGALGGAGRVFTIARPGSDLEVFMTVGAAPGAVDMVRAALDANTANVKAYGFLDHAAAFDEFRRVFADQPALIDSTKPTDVPESFRIMARDKASIDEIEGSLKHLPGVDKFVRINQSFASGGPIAPASCGTP